MAGDESLFPLVPPAPSVPDMSQLEEQGLVMPLPKLPVEAAAPVPENFLGLTPNETFQLAAALMQPIAPGQSPLGVGIGALGQVARMANQRRMAAVEKKEKKQRQAVEDYYRREKVLELRRQHAERMAMLQKQLAAIQSRGAKGKVFGKDDKAKAFLDIRNSVLEVLQASSPTGEVNMALADIMARQQYNTLLRSIGEPPVLVSMPRDTMVALAKGLASEDEDERRRALRQLSVASGLYTPESLSEVEELAVQLAEEAGAGRKKAEGVGKGEVEDFDIRRAAMQAAEKAAKEKKKKVREAEVAKADAAITDLVGWYNTRFAVDPSEAGARKFIERAKKALSMEGAKESGRAKTLMSIVKRVLRDYPGVRDEILREPGTPLGAP